MNRRAAFIGAAASALALAAVASGLSGCTILGAVSALGNDTPKTAVVCDDVHGADCGNNTATVRVDNGQ